MLRSRLIHVLVFPVKQLESAYQTGLPRLLFMALAQFFSLSVLHPLTGHKEQDINKMSATLETLFKESSEN